MTLILQSTGQYSGAQQGLFSNLIEKLLTGTIKSQSNKTKNKNKKKNVQISIQVIVLMNIEMPTSCDACFIGITVSEPVNEVLKQFSFSSEHEIYPAR